MPTFVPLKPGETVSRRPRLHSIFALAARAWGISCEQIRSKSRQKLYINARHTAFLVASEFNYTHEAIAEAAGLGCHTTVTHGVHKARYMVQYDPEFADQVQALRDMVRDPAFEETEIERRDRQNQEASLRELRAAIALEKERKDELARRKRARFDNSDQMFSRQAKDNDGVRDASRDFAALLQSALG